MKILRFNNDRVGILKGEDRVVDVTDTVEAHQLKGPQRVIEEIITDFDTFRGEFESLAAGDDGVLLADVTLLTPIPRPSHCLAAFANYLDNPDRTKEDLPNDFFYKDTNLLGPEGTVELVDIPPVLVYHPEAELAYVMGKTSRNVPEADAMDHVFGYVPFFDISARGMTRRTTFLSKGQATFGPCGPWITTKDEIDDPHDLVVQSWVNGEARQNYNTKHMAHNIPEQIAWATRFGQLEPGDVVATGTYHVGLGPLNPGDVLEIEIQGLGRARYFVKGSTPRKEIDFTPGITPVERPPGGVTKVL
ncbi:MAG: fumarylacetoacetate hydrolase family protein [SAR202 cluster bacterium]|jgi:2-keto-4-pentenoate hydratase/2-oxohepta-3-ene-1,7-dioic acid hydratase in catechol pathway|nr:fumarylacetoacetate hydrolase family protein [SAR202 cluster bacterium]MDP6512955.1 fumarylacetoacetate hydrolase family protein [SAR202 cluster bacterium]MDP6713327.1 fumarylacetoacetate hydrolase family protein [SAR202 cluster bacterium]